MNINIIINTSINFIQVYTSEGNHKFSFGKNGEKAGEFNAPTGVAVDKHGNILVADWGNSRIQVPIQISQLYHQKICLLIYIIINIHFFYKSNK